MKKIALAGMMVFGLVSVAQAGMESATSNPPVASEAAACGMAKSDATYNASRQNKTVVSFGRCECSAHTDYQNFTTYICTVDYRTEKK